MRKQRMMARRGTSYGALESGPIAERTPGWVLSQLSGVR